MRHGPDTVDQINECLETLRERSERLQDTIRWHGDVLQRNREEASMNDSDQQTSARHAPRRTLGIALTLALALTAGLAPTDEAAAANCRVDESSMSELPFIGPLAVGHRLDPALLQDQAITVARREGYADYMEFRAVAVPSSSANYGRYCANAQRDEVHMFWLRSNCSAIVVANRSDGAITRLLRDCSAAYVRTAGNSAGQSPGAVLANAVRARFGEPYERLYRTPELHREAAQSSLLGLR